MSNIVVTSIVGIAAVAGIIGAAVVMHKRKLQQQLEAATETIDKPLEFQDVVSYFRSLQLNQEEDTPFIANGKSVQMKEVTRGHLPVKEGYELLMIGSYNEKKDEITNFKFIYSPKWSDQLNEIMGKENFVVLS